VYYFTEVAKSFITNCFAFAVEFLQRAVSKSCFHGNNANDGFLQKCTLTAKRDKEKNQKYMPSVATPC